MNLFEYIDKHGTAKGFRGKPGWTWEFANPINYKEVYKDDYPNPKH